MSRASAGIRAACAAMGAVTALSLAVPAASADEGGHGNPLITAPSVTRDTDGTYRLHWEKRRPGAVYVYAAADSRDPSRDGELVTVTSSGDARITGLDPARRWYFEIAPRRSERAHGAIAADRHVALAGADNLRDLGGYETANGRTVRWGLVYRSDALAALTDADMTTLASLGLATAVDFRGRPEIDRSGPDRLPPGTAAVHLPLLDESSNALSVAIQEALRTGDPGVVDDLLGDGKGERIVVDGYRAQATSEAARAGFRQVLLHLGDDARTPLLFNCTAGKDRTGVMSAVVLRLLGVPEKAVVDDFMLSNTYLARSHERTYTYLASQGIDVELIRPLLEQRPAYLEAFFDGVRAEYGSFDRYLRDGLGLDQPTIVNLRKKLLTR
ncbi:tyrosine-protein phosphatase [Actinomadura sp. GTD37]|uniref:tyrosine-protein phosphatase n=1 Tax=Actinomadura sp. GTD37 TaxID=1778030 RepID=UPI0035C0FADE